MTEIEDSESVFLTARNINGYYAFHLFGNMAFWLPIYTMFFLARGLDFSTILLLYAVDTVVQTLLELPSGMLADRWGRRPTLMLGALAQTAGYLFIAFGNGIPWYLVGMVLHGTALAFVSGADSAFLYDTLAAAGREDEFKRIEGRAYMYNLFGWGTAGLLGGWVAAEGMQVPFVLSGVSSFLALLVMLTCVEPPRKTIRSSIRQVSREVVSVIRRSQRVRAIIIFSSVIFGLLLVGHKLSQPYLEMAGINLKYFGIVYFVWLMVAAAASNLSDRIERRLGHTVYFLLLPLLAGIPFLYWGWRQSLFGVALALTHQLVWGSLRPQTAGLINTETTASIRATVLSAVGLGTSLVYVIASPVIGGLADRQGLTVSLLYLGSAIIILGLAAVLPVIRGDHAAVDQKGRLTPPL